MNNLSNEPERELRTVFARPDDAVVLIRWNPDLCSAVDGSPAGLRICYDHVAGDDAQPVLEVGPGMFSDIVLQSWLRSLTPGRVVDWGDE